MANIEKNYVNDLVQYLHKEPKDFTKQDIIKYIEENDIKMLDFHYVGGDGRIKSLNFVVSNRSYLEQVLTFGERVDGSSLFSFVEAGSSDLYVIPRFSSAFVDPFAQLPTLGIMCSYYTKDGLPLETSPEYVLKKAAQSFREVTGMEYQTMGELEYYVIGDKEDLFPATDQKGYHESGPFAKFESFRAECMYLISKVGGMIKYGHSEVGNFTLGDKIYEQNEIEFLVTDVEESANQLIMAKWIIRKLAYEYGLDVTFAAKITTGKAGSGMHIHTRIVDKNGKNCMVTGGALNETARKAIAGYMECAPSLTAFGNMNPTSYFRLVPHQEAPTTVCWGDRNRSVLVRVPLGWTAKGDMVAMENPKEKATDMDGSQKQTVEFRCPDGSANIYLLLAGLAVAARTGFEMENAMQKAAETYVDVNIFEERYKDKVAKLASLPVSCWESAEMLDKQRAIYEKHGVFTAQMIDGVIAMLKEHKDADLRQRLEKNPELMQEIVTKFYHCG